MKKVFISSTYIDLKEYREEVKRQIEQLGFVVIDMKNFGNRSEEPKEVCFQEIENCDIMIGIYAYRYGFIPENEEFSITELEYNHATKLNKKVLCYLSDDTNYELNEKLTKFRQKIRKERTITETFTSKENLGIRTFKDLSREQKKSNHSTIQIDSETIINQYLTKLSSIYSKFDTLSGMVTDMKMNQFDLYDIYLPVTLSPEKSIDDSINNYSIDFLDYNQSKLKSITDSILEKQRKEYEIEQSQSIGFFLKKAKKIVVLGSSGQGKTILCNWLLTGFSDKRVNTEKFEKLEDKQAVEDLTLLPIIIKCKSIGNYNFPNTLEDIIRIALKDNLFDSNFIEDFIKTINHSPTKEELLIIVDGLDEIDTVENLGKFSECVQDLSDKLPQCYFVLTSRLNSYKEVEHKVGAGFKNIIVDELDAKKQQKLIEKFSKIYKLPDDTAYKILGNFDNKHTETFIKTPLILTNICLIYQKEKMVPRRIDELYESVLKLMFKRVGTQNRLPNCSDNELRRLLAWVAYEFCKENKEQFSEHEFKKIIKEYVEKNNLKENYLNNPNQILDYLCQRVNIFNNIGFRKVKADYHHFYEFRHRSYKEFLAGVSLASINNSSTKKDDDFVATINQHLKVFEPASVTYENRKVNYLKVSEPWIEPINFALMLSDREDTIAILEDLIQQKEEYSQSEYETRVALAATILVDIADESYKEIAIKIIKKLALCLNDDDDLFDSGNTMRSILFNNKLIKSNWYEIALEYLPDLYIKEYHDNDCFQKILLVIVNFLESYDIDIQSLQTKTYKDKVIYACHALNKAFYNSLEVENLEFVKRILINFLSDSNTGVAYAASWALFWLAGGKKTENGVWIPTVSEIIQLESLLIQSKSENVDSYLIDILLKVKGYTLSTIIEGEKILWNKTENINFEVKDEVLLKIIIDKITYTKSEINLRELYLGQVRLSFFNSKTGRFLLKNVEKIRPDRFVNEVIPYLIRLNSDEIFEELFVLLNHENKNIADYGKFMFARNTNANKIAFLNKKGQNCSFEIHEIINEIIKNSKNNSFDGFIIKLKADMCYKVVGRDSTGRKAYYFVKIDDDKKLEFLKHKVGDTYNLEDYGKIVYSAYGTKIPKEVKEMLKEKYGFDNLGNDDDDEEDDDEIYFSASDFDDEDDE